MPLRESAPTSRNRNARRVPTSDRTTALASVRPGVAAASSRAASTIGMPEYSVPSCATSPQLIPIRKRGGSSASSAATRLCIAAAHASASATLSGNTTIRPSPALLTSRPSASAMAARNSPMNRCVKASNASSPRRARRSVEETRSQKRIVTACVRAMEAVSHAGRDDQRARRCISSRPGATPSMYGSACG